MLIFLNFLIAAITIGMITAGLLTIIRDSKSNQNRWFFVFSAFSSFWIIANFINSNYVNSKTVLFVRLDFSLILFTFWAVLIFAIKFSTLSNSNTVHRLEKYIILPGFIINLVFFILIFTNSIVKISIQSNVLSVIFLPVSYLYISTLLIYACLFLGILVRKAWTSKGLEKTAIYIILCGIIIAILSNISTNLIFPFIIHTRSVVKELNVIGYFGLLVMIISIYVAITTQKLFNIRIVIVRSLGYFISLTAILILFVVPLLALSVHLINYKLPFSVLVYLIIITCITIILFQPVNNIFNKLTKRIFYQNYYEIQDIIDKLGNQLVGSIDPEDIQSRSINILSNAIRSKTIIFLLNDSTSSANLELLNMLKKTTSNLVVADELSLSKNNTLLKTLQKYEVAISVRLRAKHDDIGYLIFGPMQSGRSYNDNDIRLIGIASDEIAISLQNALRYKEIQNFNITLQDKINQATKDLTKVNTKLKLLDETKDDFISMASHQLRTPLTSVKGYLSMVVEGDAGEITKQQRQMLIQAFDSSQRMVYLISDLLNISRLQTGKFNIDRSNCDLSKIIEDEINLVYETAHARDIRIIYKKPAHFPVISVDEMKTRQVIMNFLDNAIHYTQQNGEINVFLENKSNTIEVRVQDNGMGVPASVVHRLFTKFYRADNAKKARPDGTGLGLFMAKKVIIAQGGSIIFSTKENRGSIFGFSLPKKI